MLTYKVIVSFIPIKSINIVKQKEIAGKLYSRNFAIIYSANEIKRIT
jgi:hypothetical protein